VNIIIVEGRNILDIEVPRARRQDRPIFLGKSPFGNTYLRRHEGDYKADEESVRRMIAEAVEDSRDDRILDDFGIDDLDKDTVNAYRNRYAGLKPENPWLDLPTREFLLRLGVMGKDRSSGKTGLRVAGLLMFGRYDTIKEIFPNYMTDYQERSALQSEMRWLDRIIPDGTWSGNLYDFFQKTIRKLSADLKVPFKLKAATRIDDTPVHIALREALTNTLIHADYTGRVSILVVKQPDLFSFRNSGLMRVSIDQAKTGGISDCRNRHIQDFFRFIGFGEHAGSGIPKIYKNWKDQHWAAPSLSEDNDHECTLLELRMINLMPDESIRQLDALFGNDFRMLPELERITLITAMTEGKVRHPRIKEISSAHPKDISDALAYLVQHKMLNKEGETRGSVYFVADQKSSCDSTPTPLQTAPNLNGGFHDLNGSIHDLGESFHDLNGSIHDLQKCLNHILDKMGFSDLPKKIPNDQMKKIILELCHSSFLKTKDLAAILNRGPSFLMQNYLKGMVLKGQLELKYPDSKKHPDQAYRSRKL